MYCKQCGKELSSDSKFCSECGTRVIEEPVKPKTIEPMFFVREAASAKEEVAEKPKKKVVHLDEFQWDLDGYPTTPKKTETINFDWASVLEEKRRTVEPRVSFFDMEIPKAKEVKEEKPQPVEPEVVEEAMEEEIYPEDLPLVTVEELLASLPDHDFFVGEPKAEAAPEETEPEAAEVPVEEKITEEDFVDKAIEEPETEVIAEVEVTEEPAVEESLVTESETEVEPVLAEEAAPEEAAPEIEEPEAAEEPPVEVAEEKSVSLEEFLFGEFDSQSVPEPTRLVRKAKARPEAEGVDKFYTFNNKQAELQALLDKEYERLKHCHDEEPVEAPASPVVPPIFEETVTEEPVATEVIVEEPAMVDEAEESPVEEIPAVEAPVEETPAAAEEESASGVKFVACVWASAPASVVVQVETKEEPAVQDVKVSDEEGVEGHKLTFHDVFDDDDDEEEKEKGGCLKALAILLCILVVVELAILGIQYFAPDSKPGQLIEKGYQYITELITGSEGTTVPEESSTPSPLEQLIANQQEKNENLGAITEGEELLFVAGKDYGYDELSDTYAFQNNPWYETEDGQTVTFGDEIVGTLIQYYSTLCDKMNGKSDEVLEYIDVSGPLYQETIAIEGSEDASFTINSLVIGEIRTGNEGFYILTAVTMADQERPDGEAETQAIYLKPNAKKKEMNIVDVHQI